ncbi:DegT/DnrJ/EryC1/StrS family aminotransferase [Acidiluteibacter ferrifornacis]|uniref:Aminotransferase class V-fold PLP-dependent enzyme n=1 Tax=Acidiluteibacter ferrifornacis TaxID=2692424 RepID=A0A6N9NIY4_9FLAO|nr:DegT/DnrJ/EryC1/StrS family aminotransferase [Acidiluteibacter ferrifornacis]NBG66646.1 aminotransferase class V-fold PLP-dependent enzyme [Acidiluteibacter ferrifornacis]
MIPVTKPYLPELSKYQDYVKTIFSRQWLTNNGPLVQQLEQKFREYLNIQNLLYVSNGTIALQLAIKALDLKGEIITTPFSYVATTSSIVWEGCKPVFVDIDSQTLNIDPAKIEAAITPRTSAILATHCFGNACDIEAIDAIAKKHHLKVIYDAAHCFGTKYKGKSIFDFGDISTTSLHATKLMHSTEGGIVFANAKELIHRMSLMRNFGHDGFDKFNGVGINGKNSEFHAAMGLCVLEDLELILKERKKQSELYSQLLTGLTIDTPTIQPSCNFNYAYYPVIFENESTALDVKLKLEKNDIYPRRYFYPSLSSLDYVDLASTPISDNIASRILCLPLYHELHKDSQSLICEIISQALIK